jgi:TolA-binding protein
VPPGDANNSFAPSTGANGPIGGPPPQGLQAGPLYTSAYGDKIAGKNDIALQEFTDYLKYFGNTDLAPSAQYYVGEINYRKADYNSALAAYDAVLEKFAENARTPDARYYKAMCLLKLNRNDSAAREFRDVYARYVNDHPDTAARAKAQLREMGLSVGATAAKRRRAN